MSEPQASTTPLLPQAFWFRLAVPCRRVDNIPKSSGKWRLDLDETCRLFETERLDGKAPWATIKAAWNPKGLAIQVDAEGEAGSYAEVMSYGIQQGVQVWVDTRDTRDIHRASRFCHAFEASVTYNDGAKKGEPDYRLEVKQTPIPRAVADAKICDPSEIVTRLGDTKFGWRIELFLPGKVLNGFDPETNRRLGFACLVVDPDHGSQSFGVTTPFPVSDNPSLWSTLILED